MTKAFDKAIDAVKNMEIIALPMQTITLEIDQNGRPSIDGFLIPNTEFDRARLAHIREQIAKGNPNYKLVKVQS